MTISSRTPEGQPGYCPVCRNPVCLLPSEPIFDAPCPSCGHLLLFLTASEQTEIMEFTAERESKIRRFLSQHLGVEDEKFPNDTGEIVKMVNDLGADSLDAVELVMALEEEWDE